MIFSVPELISRFSGATVLPKCLITNELCMSDEEKLELFKKMKEQLIGRSVDFEDVVLQSSYRKLRHHLDRLIVRLSSMKVPL